jgi:hypothetical protein
MKLIFVADVFVEQGVLGGGELNNEEFIQHIAATDHDIAKINSQALTPDAIIDNLDKTYIIANFLALNEQCKEVLSEKAKYAIYEHDHKYLTTRNPADFSYFHAPPEEIINKDFYKNAKAIFCQSSFHASIIKKNLELDNIVNLGGNIWSIATLEKLEELSSKEKSDSFAILDSSIPHKNTGEAIRYCVANKFKYNLIRSPDYHSFLDKLSSNKGLVFFPKTPETLSRLVIEARMAGMSVITNQLVGATSEPWFKLKGKPLIEVMKNKRKEIPNIILNQLE